jgi:hypothetical protein
MQLLAGRRLHVRFVVSEEHFVSLCLICLIFISSASVAK